MENIIVTEDENILEIVLLTDTWKSTILKYFIM